VTDTLEREGGRGGGAKGPCQGPLLVLQLSYFIFHGAPHTVLQSLKSLWATVLCNTVAQTMITTMRHKSDQSMSHTIVTSW